MNTLLSLVLTLQNQMNGQGGTDPLEHFTLLPAGHHVADPAGNYEYVLVVAGVIITLLVTFFTIKFFFEPGEAGAGHIKRRILRDDR